MGRNMKPEMRQTVYELFFLKALADCFPKKGNRFNLDRQIRLRTVDLSPSAVRSVQTECERWIDRNFFNKTPEVFLASKVILGIHRLESRACNVITVTDGIVMIGFILDVSHASRMNVRCGVRRMSE